MHEILEKRPYKHFKGNLYYVHEIVCHSETGELYVSYQALYSPYKFYIKPLNYLLQKLKMDVQIIYCIRNINLNYMMAISTENYDRLSGTCVFLINRISNIQ